MKNYKKLVITSIVVVALLVLLFSLTNYIVSNRDSRHVSEMKSLSGRTIHFYDGGEILSPSKSSMRNGIFSKNVKVITYIDYELPCRECIVREINTWKETINSITPHVDYFLIIESENRVNVEKMICDYGLDVPVLYYSTDAFGEKNGIKGVLARNKTYLLDKENKIVVVGEPFANEKLLALYQKTVQSLSN